MKMPKEILIYVCDHDKGKPIYAAVSNIDDIPEDCHGQWVGNYTLNRVSVFNVKRELKAKP